MKKNLYTFILFIITVTTTNAQNWLLNGNAGINAANNFIGTTDAKPLTFRTDNVERMRITKTGKIGIGTTIPGARFNVLVGSNVSLTNTDSFLLGSLSSYNLAFDNNEIQARNNSNANTLFLNYWGGAVWLGNHSNSAVPAVYTATDGKVGIGSTNVTAGYALTVNASSSLSGVNVTDPVNNYSIYCTKSGSGRNAYFVNTSSGTSDPTIYGQNNGYGEGVYGAGNNAAGVFGYSSSSIGVYGKSGSYYGIYALGGGGAYSAYINGDIYATGMYLGSDKTLKQNIHDFKNAMNIINQLQPKQYHYRQDGNYKLMSFPQGEHYGLIAQDVEKILPGLVKETKFETKLANPNADAKSKETIDFKALNYTELIPLIIKGMQEQQQVIADLQNKNDQLQQQLNELKQLIISNNSNLNKLTAGAYLLQNAPNPFNQNTTISYVLPQNIESAKIVFVNKAGSVLKEINIAGSGKGSINISAATFASGVYSYSLYANGRLVDTKQMVLTK